MWRSCAAMYIDWKRSEIKKLNRNIRSIKENLLTDMPTDIREITDLKEIVAKTDAYNLHSHTQFCDGRDSMEAIADAARDAGMVYLGFTPHSPVPIKSPCNMLMKQLDEYYAETDRLREKHVGVMEVGRSLEIDYLGPDYGPHVDIMQRQPLDYRLGSVHFVPNQSGVLLDCDGRFERFAGYLKDGYGDDLRYVVEKYFEQVLMMIERGGFELLGHFDKIAGNASQAWPGLEDERWYEALIDDVVSGAASNGLVVEINTKAYAEKGRFYPAERWWNKLIEAGVAVAIDSDVHSASKIMSGRAEALEKFAGLKKKY